MSIFKDSGIIIKTTKLKDKEFLYTIFTKTFWKILAKKKFSKKEKSLDLWYYINFEIETSKKIESLKTSEIINKIRFIKILNEFQTSNRNFIEINNYLILLNTILKKTAFWVENMEILEIIKAINIYSKEDLEIKLILANLKIINILWELDIQNKNETISKILKFISKNNIKTILKLNWINEEIKKELQNINKLYIW